MGTHDTLIAWLLLEALLLVPAVSAVLAFALRRWIFRAFATFPEDMYLAAVVYPFMGAVVGGVAAFGISDLFHADVIPGAAYFFTGLAIAAYAGGSIAKARAETEQAPPDRFSVEEWRRDLDHIIRLRRVSREDRREFVERARELAMEGKRACEEAQRQNFRVYWRGLRRRTRIFVNVWLAAGFYVAINQSLVTRSAWYLASSLAGGSAFLAVWIGWCDARMVKNSVGTAQLRASEMIRQRLQRLPDAPVPSLRQRLAMLISPGRDQ